MSIDEDKIKGGIGEFEKFKALSLEAVNRAKLAEEDAIFFRGQKEQLEQLLRLSADRHRADLARIAEMEAFITSLTEHFRLAEERLRLGDYRRAGSVSAQEIEIDEGLRKLANSVADGITRLGPVPEQKRSKG